MSASFLEMLGARVSEGARVVSVEFGVHPVAGWGAFVFAALAVVGVVCVSYRMRDLELSASRRALLAVLRGLALLGVAAILLRPALGLTVEGLVRQILVLLFDESASMALRDPRLEPADQVRAAIAEGRLPAAGGLGQRPPGLGTAAPARLDLVRAALTNRELDLISGLSSRFELKAAGFAGELRPGLGGLGLDARAPTGAVRQATGGGSLGGARIAAELRADGRQTAVGTALREVLERERGRPLGGVVIFTDGLRNAGADVKDVVQHAKEAGVAVHFVGVGTTAPRDLQVVEVAAPDVAFVRDEVPVQVRIRSRGLAGQVARVSLSLDAEKADEREITLPADGETVVAMKCTPQQTGDFQLTLEVPARPDEILPDNNRQSRRFRVIDDRLRVLFLEQSPRWEFRYLQALLLRDRRVDLKCVLFDGDPVIARNPGSPYLEAFPARREDLFAYDLVIFGDVDPKNFTVAQLDLLGEFVARSGGSLLMLAGRRFSPWSYRDTALERLLPVEFDGVPGMPAAGSVYDRPVKVALTPAGRASPLLRQADEPEENLRRWEAMPPLFWVAPVRRAKPAAEILLADPARGDAGEPLPVLALQQYGVGQTMFIGTDNVWRWRRNEGESFFVSFWGRVVQRLAVNHLLSGSRRTQLMLDRTSVLPGERIGVTARLFNSAFEPLTEAVVPARIELQGGARAADPAKAAGSSELLLRGVPDQPGVYRGEIPGSVPGRYRVTLGEDTSVAMDFTVEDRWVEAGETAMSEATLKELASAGGGTFSREEDLPSLPERVGRETQRVQSRVSVELWSSPFYFCAVLLLLVGEWVLRKLWQLK